LANDVSHHLSSPIAVGRVGLGELKQLAQGLVFRFQFLQMDVLDQQTVGQALQFFITAA
jgi:hypothetical protein